jgi:hypothetical protein
MSLAARDYSFLNGIPSQVVHKFGRNLAVGTSFVPVCLGGIYNTPQVGSETRIFSKS